MAARDKKTLYLDIEMCNRLARALRRLDADLSVSSVLNQQLLLVTPFYEEMARGVELASPEVLYQSFMKANEQSDQVRNAVHRSILGIATPEDLAVLNNQSSILDEDESDSEAD